MKPTNDNIEEYLRQKLANTEVDLPDVEAFWDRIDPEKPKKRRPIIFWFMIGLVGLLSMIWVVNSEGDVAIGKGKQTIAETRPVISKEEGAPSRITKKGETNQGVSISQDLSNSSEKQASPTKAVKGQNDQQSISSMNKDKSGTQDLSSTTDQVSMYEFPVSKSKKLQPILEDENQIRAASNSGDTVYKTTPSSDEEEATVIIDPIKNISPALFIPYLTLELGRVEYAREAVLVSTFDMVTNPKFDFAKNAKENNRWYWQIQADAGRINESIQINEGNTSPLIAENYRQHVTPLASYMIQIAIGRELTHKSRISLGLEYQHVEKQYEISEESLTKEKVWNPTAFINNGQVIGDTIIQYVSQKSLVRKPIEEVFVNLPVSFQYTVFENKRFDVAI